MSGQNSLEYQKSLQKASGQPSKNASVSHTVQMGSDQILGGKGREARLWIGSGAIRSFLYLSQRTENGPGPAEVTHRGTG